MRRVVCVALLVGCRTTPFSEPALDGGAPDLARDLAAGTCTTHTLQTVSLASLTAPDPPPHRLGAVVRLVAGIPRRACDVPGALTVEVHPGNAVDSVQLTAQVWISSGECGDPLVTDRLVTLTGGAGISSPRLLVRDGAPGSKVALDLALEAPVSSSCTPPLPEGSCTRDCQCVPKRDTDGCIQGGCITPCSEDVDCPSGYRCQAASLMCAPPVDPCCPGGCPFGQSCVECICRVTVSNQFALCGCDADCPAGQLCRGSVCILPCATVHDCPSGNDLCIRSQCDSTI
jgi:hypothetical protein